MIRFWNFAQSKEKDGEIELRIEGEIISDDDAWLYEWFGIDATTPNQFKAELAQYEGRNITVWIDSWGGDVFAASVIYNALKEHKGRVVVKIDGKAVSAASIIAMAGEEVLMSPVSIMMIHNPWTDMRGEAKEFRHAADILDQVKESIINSYQIKTGRSRSKISQLMDEETWMSPKKAMTEGFADGILYADGNAEPANPAMQNSFMFSRLAIQNSVSDSMRRFFEQCRRLDKDKPPESQNKPPEAIEQAENGLLDIYTAIAQANKNKGR